MISNGNEFYGDLENLFPHFIDLTDDSFVVIRSDKDFPIEFISNDRFVENLGYTPESILGSSFLHIIHSEDVEKMVNLLKEIGNSRLHSEEIRIKSFSSEIYWVDISLKKLNNKIFVNLKNISKIKDIESGEKYRLLYENANDLIRVFNEKFEFEYLNENVHKRVLGYSKDELIGKTQLQLYHPDDRKEALLSLSKILRTGRGSYQARFQHKNGEYKWLELSAKNFIDTIGNRKILSIARDITGKKLAEQKLKESEEKYRELVDLLPDIIFETDKNLNLTYVNSVAFNKFGYSIEDVKVGLNISSLIHPDYKEKAYQQIKKLFEGGETNPNEYLLCKKDGTCFYARIHSRPILKDDIIAGIRGTITDINEITLAEQELMESEEKFRTMADQSFIGIIIIQDGIFKYLNDITLTINGFTKEEIKKWDPYEFSKIIHPDDKEFVMGQVKKKEKG
ncbi:MAG: PAS domain S-box protein, partial [Promethearchaeota archaeon]